MAPQIGYELEGRWVSIPLEGKEEVTVGRDKRNDIVLPIPWISRRHARIYRDERGWHVADLGSSLGTRINDLGHANTTLGDGDRIYLHTFSLLFSERGAVQPGVELTGADDPDALAGSHTVFHDAVDFTGLAAREEDASRSRRLLELIAETSRTILTSRDLDATFALVLDLAFRQVTAPRRGFVMLHDAKTGSLDTRAVKLESGGGDGEQIRFSRTIAGKVLRDRVGVLTLDAQADTRFAGGASVFELGIRSAMAAPIWQEDRVEGLIYVDTLRLNAFTDFDLDVLSAIGNQLAIAIEQARLQRSILEQQLVRRRLERYHSPAVIQLIAERAADQEGQVTAEELDATVLFADVVGFTTRCESMAPREVAEMLNRYFSEMADCVFQHHGTLDKFIGDCVMAVFGAPLPHPDHARHAAEAALDMRDALERLNRTVEPAQRVAFRVGLHSGRVVAGDIGSLRRSDYTVLGATVNLAARLESSVATAGQIVISEDTRRAIGDAYLTHSLGERKPKGLTRPIACHELVGRAEPGEIPRETAGGSVTETG